MQNKYRKARWCRLIFSRKRVKTEKSIRSKLSLKTVGKLLIKHKLSK